MNNNHVRNLKIIVREENFDSNFEIKRLADKCLRIGAIVSFLGLVRDLSKNRDLKCMEIEHYSGMSEKMIRDFCQKAFERWDLEAITLIHRVGKLFPGDNIVLLIVASPHRTDAFNASEFIMDYLKSEAPFWKKETTSNGTSWVEESALDKQKLLRW